MKTDKLKTETKTEKLTQNTVFTDDRDYTFRQLQKKKPRLRKIVNVLRPKAIEFIGDVDMEVYNCWGFTSFCENWLTEVYWMADWKIAQLLDKFTRRLKKDEKVKFGDVLVFKNSKNEITHTAIALTAKKMLHKYGRSEIEITTVTDYLLWSKDSLAEVRRKTRRVKVQKKEN